MSRSLQSRVLITSALGTAVVLLVSHAAMYGLVSRAMQADFDDALAARARTIAALVERDGDSIEIELESHPLPEFERSERPEFYEVRDAHGRSVLRSARLPESGLGGAAAGMGAMRLPDGRPGRFVAIRYVPVSEHHDQALPAAEEGTFVTLILARDTQELQGTLVRLRWVMSIGAVIATSLAVVFMLLVVRAGLRTLPNLSARIAAIDPQQLDARIDATGVPAEFDPVVDCVNRLLTRVQNAFDRERRFTSDVAHELRTPLAGLRSILEVTLTRTRDPLEYQKALIECLTISNQTQSLAESLLVVARGDANQLVARRESFKLRELLDECWPPLAVRAENRGLHVVWGVAADLALTTDAEMLRMVLQNLLGNAVSHSDANGIVEITAQECDGGTRIEIANSGSALEPEQMTRVFDRFWRGDAARNNTGEHAGLGLSLCQTLMETLGGTIHITGTAGGRFRVVIQLPSDLGPLLV